MYKTETQWLAESLKGEVNTTYARVLCACAGMWCRKLNSRSGKSNSIRASHIKVTLEVALEEILSETLGESTQEAAKRIRRDLDRFKEAWQKDEEERRKLDV